jgi:glycopeptide antibiotics resistance protein
MRVPAMLWLVGWLVLTIPWTSFSVQPHWPHVTVIPFQHGPRLDDLRNLLFYVPVGAFAAGWRWPVGRTVVVAALLSGTTEFAQIFSTTRYPSTQDLVANVAGAVVGFVLWQRARQPVAGSG